LIHNPEVLILDEPTSGLDPNQIIEIRQVIKEQGKNKLVLFSSHILQEVQAICDRVIIIHKGEIVADDQLNNLQKQSGTTLVTISFKESIEAEWLKQLQDVDAIHQFSNQTWHIETTKPEHVRKQLLELALKHNLNILSMQSENESLEKVFRSLTANVNAE
jgi:ABC-2 type transport system ATP-binding protein